MNAVEIEVAISALAEQAFDSVEFPFAFLQAFGNKETTIKRLRAGASNNINRAKLENLIHRIFNPAQLDIEIKDRFGNPVIPLEWFLVPRFVIDEAVDRIRDGTITDYTYDPKTATLLRTNGA
jgi:hypothetical protein